MNRESVNFHHVNFSYVHDLSMFDGFIYFNEISLYNTKSKTAKYLELTQREGEKYFSKSSTFCHDDQPPFLEKFLHNCTVLQFLGIP